MLSERIKMISQVVFKEIEIQIQKGFQNKLETYQEIIWIPLLMESFPSQGTEFI